jgi:hypothetical protein
MANKQQRHEFYGNRLCCDIGHDWQATTSDQYRVCKREHCHAAQRRVQGHWTNAVHERPWADPIAAWNKRAALPQQQTLL